MIAPRKLRPLLVLLAIVGLFAFCPSAASPSTAADDQTQEPTAAETRAAIHWQRDGIRKHRAATGACRQARFRAQHITSHAERSRSVPFLNWTRLLWKNRHAQCERKLAIDRHHWRANPVAYAKQVARWLLARRGISEQFWALDGIIMGESSWHVCAHYPRSSNCNYQGGNAYGIPQALPGSKMASMGADWHTNPLTQLRWMLRYCETRYGGLIPAYHHRMAYGSY